MDQSNPGTQEPRRASDIAIDGAMRGRALSVDRDQPPRARALSIERDTPAIRSADMIEKLQLPNTAQHVTAILNQNQGFIVVLDAGMCESV